MYKLINDLILKYRLKGPYEYLQHGNISSVDHKFIYVYIPKVASSSIKLLLAEMLNIPSPVRTQPDCYPHRRHYPFIKKEDIPSFEDFYKFYFVRNPYNRLLSCYLDKIKKNDNFTNYWFKKGISKGLLRYGDIFYAGMSFERFAQAIASIPDEDADEHFKSQHTFPDKLNLTEYSNFVGRIESFAKDIQIVFNQIGFKEKEIPHLLKTGSHGRLSQYYTDEIRNIIYKRYEKDFHLFGYVK